MGLAVLNMRRRKRALEARRALEATVAEKQAAEAIASPKPDAKGPQVASADPDRPAHENKSRRAR